MTHDPCEQFFGRLRDICRGFDDDGKPIKLPRGHRRSDYLRLWREQGLITDAVPETCPPVARPGTELKLLLESLGIAPKSGCGCKSRVADMDRWGVSGCREHRAEIVAWLRESGAEWGVTDWVGVAWKAVATGVAWRINPLLPVESLVDEAIRRAVTAPESSSSDRTSGIDREGDLDRRE